MSQSELRCHILVVAIAGALTVLGCRRTNPTAKPSVQPGPPPVQSISAATTQAVFQFQRDPRHITLATDEVRVPFEMVTGMPYIPFQAADGTMHRLILDTGADSVLFSPELVAAQHLTTRPSDRTGRDAKSAYGDVAAARVPALDLGVVRFEDFDADVHKLFAGSDALLGWPLYRALLVTIDYPHRSIVFSQGDLPPADGKDILPLRLQQDRLEIQANIDGKDSWIAFDTGWGNGSNVELTKEQAGSLQWASPPVPMMLTNTAAGGVAEKLGRLKGDMILGRHRIVQPIAGTNEGTWIGVIGAMTLSQFTVMLDLRHLRVRLQRPDNEPIKCDSVRVAGFSCDLTSHPLKVIEVLPNSEAQRADLRVGDLLLTVNGQPALDGLLSNTSDSFAIELQRGDEKLSLKVPMTTLVP